MATNLVVISASNDQGGHAARALPNNKKIFSKSIIHKKILMCFCLFVFLLCGFSINVNAASVTLSWERNQEPDIAGYKIFYGTASRSYTNTITINDTAHEPLTRNYTIVGLEDGKTYYFAIKAFDLAGQESDFSDEVSVEIPQTVVNGTDDSDGEGESGDDSDTTTTNWYENEDWIEVGSVTITHKWKKIELNKTFQNPVVIVGPPTFNGTQPCVIRIKNVEANSFEMRIQEWMYLDGIHLPENVSYMVVEAGEHFLPDGSLWEAGKFSLSGTLKWKKVVFPTPFSVNPQVFLTVQTFNGSQAVTMRERQVTGDYFVAAMQEEERLNDGHLVETVGYLAIEPGNVDGVRTGYIICNHEFVAVSNIGKQLKLEEEQSRDKEVNHVIELVSLLRIGEKNIFAQIQTFKGGDTVSLRIR